MNIQTALKQGLEKLKKTKPGSEILDATLLMAKVFHQDKEFVYTYPEKELTKSQAKRFEKIIAERAKGVPVAYLTNSKDFFGFKFYVNRTVLIPRPETEILVEEALKIMDSVSSVDAEALPGKLKKFVVADIGSGSGAIAVSIKIHRPEVEMYATDSCARALKVAGRNAKDYSLKIHFLKGNLLEPLKNKKIDLIIANLPYLEIKLKNHKPTANTIGLKFEPAKALYSGEDGLSHYRKFFKQLANKRQKPKIILIEIGENQGEDLTEIIKTHFPTAIIQMIADLCGRDRVMKIVL